METLKKTPYISGETLQNLKCKPETLSFYSMVFIANPEITINTIEQKETEFTLIYLLL